MLLREHKGVLAGVLALGALVLEYSQYITLAVITVCMVFLTSLK
jgi:hypothetical protein